MAQSTSDNAPHGDSGVKNGGFEEGTAGWQWEQWKAKPLPGVIEKKGAAEGEAAFRMGVAGAPGGRWLAKEIAIPDPARDYVFSFSMKLQDVPEGAVRATVGIPNKGWLRGGDLVRLGGTQDWKTYRFAVPAQSLGGATKVTTFFYHDQIGSGTLWLDALSFLPGTLAAGETAPPAPAAAALAAAARGTTLSATSSRPAYSTYALGEKVALTFTVADLKKTAGEALRLQLSFVDEHEKVIENKDIAVPADGEGSWTTTVTAPADKLGFYRVRAKLSNGVPLQGAGSRAPGFITYAVVPDPAQRTDFGEKETRFGMQGGFGPWRDEVLRLLGSRWILDGSLEWKKTEPDRAGQFDETKAVRPRNTAPAWKTYTLPTLYAAPKWAVKPETLSYMTGTLTPEGEKAWDAYCRKAARAYAANNPDRAENVYQITWEPIPSWGFKGTGRDLVRIYEIAYRALHEADPKAVVAGPTRGVNNNDPQKHVPLFKLGLGKYLDAFTTHPYFSINPEKDGMVRDIRSMKKVLDTYAKPGIPMLGTEQGWSTEEDLSKELTQARGLIRQNLITLGEGFRFNMAFYIADYRLSGQKGYGYYYTHDEGVPFGPKQISPRPIAPAYAAQSFLLEGHDSAGAIEWLGETAWGYAFARPGSTILALWDHGTTREVSLPVGVETVRVYDWMGNERTVSTKAGMVTLNLGPEPVYVAGVSARLWGKNSEKVVSFANAELQAYPGAKLSVPVSALLPSRQPIAGTLNMEPDARLKAEALTRPVTLGSDKRVDQAFELQVPATARPGSYPLKLMLRDAAGNSLAAAGATLEVISPVSVAAVRPTVQQNGQNAIEVTLKDERGQGIAGTLEFRLKEVLPGAARSDLPMIDIIEDEAKTKEVAGTQRQVAFKIPAGGMQKLTLTYPQLAVAPDKTYQAVSTLTTDAGYKFTHTQSINFLAARRMEAAPTIDGQLGEWTGQAPIALGGQSAIIRAAKQYTSDADLAAQWRLAWDTRALYLAVDVTDDVFHQTRTGEEMWNGDSLQLSFDLDARRDLAEGEKRHTEINVALTPDGPQAFRSLTFDLEKYPFALLTPAQLPVAVRREGVRTTYEIAIPWRELGSEAAPPNGMLGFAAAVNDSDGPDDKEPTALGLFSGIHPNKNPEGLGLLVLAGQ